MPACKWRRPHREPGRYQCRSPLLIVGRSGVDEATCIKCPCPDKEAGPNQEQKTVPIQPRRSLRCVHLGPEVPGAKRLCWAKSIYECTKGHGEVCPGRQCQTCTDYEEDD